MSSSTTPDLNLTTKDTAIPRLGNAKIPSPDTFGRFTSDDDGIQILIHQKQQSGADSVTFFEEAGPREHLYYDPSKAKCAIVTCGGLCPGINDVIRSIYMEARETYDVPAVLGIRFGLQGFIPHYGHDVMELSRKIVDPIHEFGGTILGTSRGPQPSADIVDTLERMNISILFMIGGDGTMRAMASIVEEISSRNLKISVIGIPKTIDNDISFVTKSFGFDTAVEEATEAIRCAHSEALGAVNGIGLVKLMGRESGHIAAQAALALRDVDFVLIPEDPFDLHGEHGFLAALQQCLDNRQHAVIVVAEGAGQDLCKETGLQDASGNIILADISTVLIDAIKTHFKSINMRATLKYIDPSYIIRSVSANANDCIYCGFLGQHAVHAAMAGKTGMVVSRWNGRFVYIPLSLVTQGIKHVNTRSNFWRAVLSSTGQPHSMKNP